MNEHRVIEVLLADGWHTVLAGTFALSHPAGHTQAEYSFTEGVDVGTDNPPMNQVRIAGPRTSLLAVRESMP